MKSIQQKAIQQAIDILNALGAKYFVTGDGYTYKNIEVEMEKPPQRQRNLTRPYGALVSYYRPFIENMKVGDVAQIPTMDFKPTDLQAAIAAWATQHWGHKTYMTTVSGKFVEVMRIKEKE